MAPPPPPPLCLPFSSGKTKYDDDGRPRRRRDQYRSYSDGSSLSRSYTYDTQGIGGREYRNSNHYDRRTGNLGRTNAGKLTRSKSQHARNDGIDNSNSRGLPVQRHEVYDNEKTSFQYDDYDDNVDVNPDVGHTMSAGGSPASRPSKVPKNNSRSTARRTEPRRTSLESGSYSPTATMTSKAEKLTFNTDSSSYNVPTLLTEATQVPPPKKTFWRRLGLGYGWGLKKSREREREKERLGMGESYPYSDPDNLTMQNNQSPMPMLYSTDSNVTIPGPGLGNNAAPVLSTKASSLQMQMQMQRDAERSGLTRNSTGRSNGSGGVTLAVPSPPLHTDAEANRNPLSRSTTTVKKKPLPNVNRSNTKNSTRPSMESHNSAASSNTLIGSALDRKINDPGPVRERVDTGERLAALRAYMSGAAGGGGAEGLAFYVVPSDDAHGSEYVANSDKRRQWISGFTGSAGQAIITPTEAFLLTDSRYWLQAEVELDENWVLVRVGSSNAHVPAGAMSVGGSSVSSPLSPGATGEGEGYFDRSATGFGAAIVGPDGFKDWIGFLLSRITSPAKVGIDARLISHSLASYLSTQLSSSNGSKLIYPPQNLIDMVWKDRPSREARMIGIHELRFAGMKAQAKLEMVRAWIRDRPISRPSYKRGEVKDGERNVGMLVSALDNIAWVLNLRGSDIPYNPVFHSYLFIGLNSATTLFIDRAKVSDEVGSYLADVGVEIQEYNAIWTFLRKKPWGPGKIIVPAKTSHAIVLMLTYLYYTLIPASEPSPIASFQAVKNPTEAEGLRQAYLRDGVAFVKWQAWLEDKLGKGYQITEYEASARLTEYRIQVDKVMTGGNHYMGLAYESISASGAHAALPHYTPVKDDLSFITRETPYVMDSGGQYLDGTCDTTRTMHFGRPTPEMCEAYTRVLQGHIAIDSAIFPNGTSGMQLDVLARRALWKDGLNYLHGTGHGFGSFLNVHEGPQGFSSPVPLVPGHVLTNEPGFYNDGNWGMRIESSLLVRRMKTKNEFQGDIWLGFERLTIVPIQTRMVKESMLTKEEIQWLKDHNRRCREKLETYLKDDPRALKWLLRETDRGIGIAEINLPGGIKIDWH